MVLLSDTKESNDSKKIMFELFSKTMFYNWILVIPFNCKNTILLKGLINPLESLTDWRFLLSPSIEVI